jgi:hypothetical protein
MRFSLHATRMTLEAPKMTGLYSVREREARHFFVIAVLQAQQIPGLRIIYSAGSACDASCGAACQFERRTL